MNKREEKSEDEDMNKFKEKSEDEQMSIIILLIFLCNWQIYPISLQISKFKRKLQ